jgi:hypothetical protein
MSDDRSTSIPATTQSAQCESSFAIDAEDLLGRDPAFLGLSPYASDRAARHMRRIDARV